MDTKGNIRQFASDLEAKAEGFDTHLTRAQAELLDKLEPHKRHAELVKLQHAEYLAKIKAAEADGLRGRTARRVASRSAKKPAHSYR